jgi:hypothetical protein
MTPLTPRGARIAGLGILLLMVVHVIGRPEHAWLLISGCDLAAIATGVGLIVPRPRWVATACLFQAMVGLPSLIIGMLTTYDTNVTGVAIHVVPLALGATIVARDGLPRRAALIAWIGAACSMIVARLIGPPELNLNFANAVWPPLAHIFPFKIMFQACALAVVGGLLTAGAWLVALYRRPGRTRP